MTAAARDAPPFPVAAVVEEDDTYHVLSGRPAFAAVDEHPLRVLADAHDARPSAPGTVVVRPGTPLRLLAVVHKLDEEPTWRERWVADAFVGVLRETERRGLRSIAMPLLGSVRGTLDRDRSGELLARALDEVQPRSLERVWLVEDPV